MIVQWNLKMRICLGPPVCVLIIEVVLYEGLINILIGQLGVLIIEVVLFEDIVLGHLEQQ